MILLHAEEKEKVGISKAAIVVAAVVMTGVDQVSAVSVVSEPLVGIVVPEGIVPSVLSHVPIRISEQLYNPLLSVSRALHVGLNPHTPEKENHVLLKRTEAIKVPKVRLSCVWF